MSLEGKTALITGAAGTLGHAVAEAFKEAGANRILLDIDAGALEAAHGGKAINQILVTADLGDRDAVIAACQEGIDAFGAIDIACNIAGGFAMGDPVHGTPVEVWDRMMGMNAVSVLNAAAAVVPHMLAAGGGKIVNIGAMGGLKGGGDMGAYAASKSAVIRLTESMAGELREKNINVNCVLPSIIDTQPNRDAMPDADPANWVTPDALADVILFLASDAARAVHGAAVPVVGLS
jgi:NAD(P)-dependent dehydrogenase (short-subunit alcohol dehydrogenase family)